MPTNRFYAQKFGTSTPPPLRSWADLQQLPFTTKAELLADQQQHPPYGSNLTYPVSCYSRLHQTSGTSTGQPLRWLDTPTSWEWILDCWRQHYQRIGLTAQDRVFFPFSFGPFLGFWSAFESAARLGAFVAPGGGMSSLARLRFILDHGITVVFATPTYALHLADLAAREKIDLANSLVRALVVAGEPGGSIPATRQRIASAWGARVYDHFGLTEVGPVAIEATDRPGSLEILEKEYLAEVVDTATGEPVGAGEVGELVLTNLGRLGSPLIRYRTGDWVRLAEGSGATGDRHQRLEGGILGRVDDMIHIRGNNVYPSAIEGIVRRFAEVVEFRLHVDQSHPLADLRLEIEPTPGAEATIADAISRAIRDELLFRVDVTLVPPGSLPRFEMKARRVVRIPPRATPERISPHQ
ncbi:MAG: AMP-binding protein [Gemmataceae bacterium]|nr:AMP-binding protein [Gemmata sp.]MDW8197502.1 AMP-binding protein [Gemmataceae bacterium]